MPWAKLDDQYPDHPKIVAVGPLGMALHTAALCYCARYLTDGFIPAAMITRLISLDGISIENNGVSHAVSHKELTDILTSVGLFEEVEGGFFVHDYLEYNPPAAQVKAERAENAKRQAEWREKKRGKSDKSPTNGDSNAVTNNKRTSAPSPSPFNSSPKGEESPQVFPIAAAIADVCKMNLEANKGRLLKEAKTLCKANPKPTPDLIRLNYGANRWWYRDDWRGKKGELPNPPAIRETWGKWTIPPQDNFHASENW